LRQIALVTSDRSVSLKNVANTIADCFRKHGFTDIKMIYSPNANPALYKDVSFTIIVMTMDPAWIIPYCYIYHALKRKGKKVVFYTTVEGKIKNVPGSEWVNREIVFTANSKYTKKMLVDSGYKVDRVIYHGVNIREIQSFKWNAKLLRSRLGLKEDDFVIGYIAGGYLRKGHEVFAEVIRILEKKDPSIKAVVVTDKNGVGKYSNVNNVIVVPDFGKLSKATIYGLYHMFDLYVQASLSEGFGLPCLEALAAGKPVVHPAYEPLTEITDEKTSFRVDVVSVDYRAEFGAILYELHYYNPEEMADMILYAKDQLMKNKDEYQVSCLERARMFDYMKTYKAFIDIYKMGGLEYEHGIPASVTGTRL